MTTDPTPLYFSSHHPRLTCNSRSDSRNSNPHPSESHSREAFPTYPDACVESADLLVSREIEETDSRDRYHVGRWDDREDSRRITLLVTLEDEGRA
jgi:hypothetical protein